MPGKPVGCILNCKFDKLTMQRICAKLLLYIQQLSALRQLKAHRQALKLILAPEFVKCTLQLVASIVHITARHVEGTAVAPDKGDVAEHCYRFCIQP